jgi:hypothetical protein
MKIAWQSWVLLALGAAQYAIVAMLGNISPLGLENQPWLTLVLLPAISVIVVGAANQLKALGQPPPGQPLTTETTKAPQP